MTNKVGRREAASPEKSGWNSLRTRMTIFTLTTFLITIWALALYIHGILHSNLEKVMGDQQLMAVSVLAADVNAAVEERITALETAAARITPEMLDNRAVIQKYLEDRSTLATLFNSGLWICDAAGVGVADVPIATGRIGTDYSDRAFMIGAMKGRTTIGRPVMGKKLKAPAFAIAAPIKDAQGKVVGALLGAINLGQPNFLDRVSNKRFGKYGDFLLVAKEYRLLVTSSDKSRIMEELPAKGVNPLLDRFISGEYGSGITRTPKGVEVLASSAGVPATGWYVAAIMPTSEAFSAIHDLQKHLLLVTLAMTILAGLLTRWMLKRELTPVFEAISTLATLSDSRRQLPVTKDNEIGELIGAFNRLLTTLGEREKALLETEAKQRAMIANISDVIAVIDTDGITRYKSPNIERIFGWRPDEVVGLSVFEMIHAEDLERIRAVFAGMLAVGGTATDQCRYRCRDGSYRWIEFSGLNLATDPVINGILVNYCDISQKKLADEERENLQNQLLQSQKMESVGRLAGGVAHDFNNKLSVILGYADIAMIGVSPDTPLYSRLMAIHDAATSSADLTRQLLAFARKQTIMPKVLDLNEAVSGMLKMIRRLIGEDIELTWQPDARPSQVKMDESQLDQLLANLCVNARDAISGIGRIAIVTGNIVFDEAFCTVHKDHIPGSYVSLTVSDTGCGMDRETQANIFEPFFTTKEAGKGTGLGLATVYGIVRQNSGFVSVYSEVGTGTTFRVYLPGHEGCGAAEQKERQDVPVPHGSETVLLIEDERPLLNMSREMLQNLGYKVLAAGSKDEALLLAERHGEEIELLLTDVIMPRVNGLDLSRELLRKLPSMKVLFMSGYTADVIANQGVLDDGVNFIQKPYSIRMLAEKIREVLG